MYRAFNESYFDLRYKYNELFYDCINEYEEEDEDGETIYVDDPLVLKYKDLKNVAKPRLIAFTIGAIKSLDNTIQQQQSIITTLQEEIAVIKSHLNI